MTPFTYRITPHGRTAETRLHPDGSAVPYGARHRTAAAFTAAATGFALDAGADHLLVDHPMATGFFFHGDRRAGRGNGLTGVFPPDLSGFHQGARLPLAAGLALLRAMLLREGTWCRLHTDDGFFLHVGEHDDLYVGGPRPAEEAVARTRRLGLSADPVDRSPYDPALDLVETLPAADDSFWVALHVLVAERGGVLLEEQPVANHSRWHRLTGAAQIAAVRSALPPQALLVVWPDLTDDIEAVRAVVRHTERLHLLVEQHADGRTGTASVAEPWMGRDTGPHPRIGAGPGRRAGLVPLERADRRPLLTGVVPDTGGTARTRRRTDPTPADERRAFLASLRVGDIVTGTVASGLDDVGVHVDLHHPRGRDLGFLRVPEMSWGHFDSLDDVAPVGREIRAEILDVDWSFERVGLSVRALLPSPWRQFAAVHRAGDTVRGVVTRSAPFGVFLRIAPGVEGLLPHDRSTPGLEAAGADPAAAPAPAPAPVPVPVPAVVGEEVLVTLAEVDGERCRVLLAPFSDGPQGGPVDRGRTEAGRPDAMPR